MLTCYQVYKSMLCFISPKCVYPNWKIVHLPWSPHFSYRPHFIITRRIADNPPTLWPCQTDNLPKNWNYCVGVMLCQHLARDGQTVLQNARIQAPSDSNLPHLSLLAPIASWFDSPTQPGWAWPPLGLVRCGATLNPRACTLFVYFLSIIASLTNWLMHWARKLLHSRVPRILSLLMCPDKIQYLLLQFYLEKGVH